MCVGVCVCMGAGTCSWVCVCASSCVCLCMAVHDLCSVYMGLFGEGWGGVWKFQFKSQELVALSIKYEH